MAQKVDIASPSQFLTNTNPSNIGSTWKKWKKGFNIYLTAGGITDSKKSPAITLQWRRSRRNI